MTTTPPQLDHPPPVVIEGGRPERGPLTRRGIWLGLLLTVGVAAVVMWPSQLRVPEYAADPGTALASVEWLTWHETSPGPDSLLATTLTATATGFAVVGGPDTPDATMWHVRGPDTWTATELPTIPFGLVTAGDQVVAFRGVDGWTITSDGEAWRVAAEFEFPTPVRLGYGSSRPAITSLIDDRLLVESLDGELIIVDGDDATVVIEEGVWGRASEGAWEDFTGPRNTGPCQIDSVVSNDYVPIAVSDRAVVAIVGGGDGRAHGLWPACGPRVWSADDGASWAPLTEETPFGPTAYVSDIAWRDGRFLAIGGIGTTPRVWQSVDAILWTDATPTPIRLSSDDVVLVDVETGPAGWAILAEQSDRSRHSGWVSPDGSCWFRVPIAAGGRDVAVGTDAFAIAGAGRDDTVWLGMVPDDRPTPCQAG